MIPTLEIERESARLDAERENLREHWDGSAADGRVYRPGELDLSHKVILYLEGISVSFDGFKALNNLNLAIDAGELRGTEAAACGTGSGHGLVGGAHCSSVAPSELLRGGDDEPQCGDLCAQGAGGGLEYLAELAVDAAGGREAGVLGPGVAGVRDAAGEGDELGAGHRGSLS